MIESFRRAVLRSAAIILFFIPVGAHAEILWAAVALSSDGAGWVSNVQGGKEAALAAAMAKCTGDCKPSGFTDGCVSIFKYRYNINSHQVKSGYGIEGADTNGESKSKAMNACNKKHSNCQFVTTVCQSN